MSKPTAPSTASCHGKSYRKSRPVESADGDSTFAQAWEILRAAGYGGWVSIESRFGNACAGQSVGFAYLHSLAHAHPVPLSR